MKKYQADQYLKLIMSLRDREIFINGKLVIAKTLLKEAVLHCNQANNEAAKDLIKRKMWEELIKENNLDISPTTNPQKYCDFKEFAIPKKSEKITYSLKKGEVNRLW